MSLAIYRWEWKKFPWAWAVKIHPEYRVLLAQELAEHFACFRPRVNLNTRGKGRAHGWHRIDLPGAAYDCTLGLILHEVAHIAAHEKGSRGHDAAFKATLIRVHVETRVMKLLPAMMQRVRATLATNRRAYDRAVLRESAKAFRKAKAAEMRKTREYRMENLRKRIARLSTKRQRLETMMRTASRSLYALERAEAREKRAKAQQAATTGGN